MIRSGPLTSLCADKAGHTLTHTQTAIPKHQRLITHLCVIFPWLCLRLQRHTPSFIFLCGAQTGQIHPKVFTGDQTHALSFAQKQDSYQLKKAESYRSLKPVADMDGRYGPKIIS